MSAPMFQLSDAPTHTPCGYEWERDPALEVTCPVCGAAVGKPCQRLRPSGHSAWGLWAHNDRDLLADALGKYAHPCTVPPAGGTKPQESRTKADAEQLELFEQMEV